MRALSNQAQAAKLIRAELKKAFPGVKFSVTSNGYSMGDSVYVDWTDGPTRDQVHSIAGKYQEGHFDGMTDSYDYTNRRTDIPQTMFVIIQRSSSKQAA